jgi:hypothetical protein
MTARKVLLFGQSMLMSLMAASLEQDIELCVEQVATWNDVCHVLNKHMPDVLIFDMNNPYESHILPLLFRNPRLLMIGLDTESDQAVLLSGKEARALTLNQIKEIIEYGNPLSR